jgi:hypothetical protein
MSFDPFTVTVNGAEPDPFTECTTVIDPAPNRIRIDKVDSVLMLPFDVSNEDTERCPTRSELPSFGITTVPEVAILEPLFDLNIPPFALVIFPLTFRPTPVFPEAPSVQTPAPVTDPVVAKLVPLKNIFPCGESKYRPLFELSVASTFIE